MFPEIEDKELKLSALPAEVSGFVQSIQDKAERGMKEHSLYSK